MDEIESLKLADSLEYSSLVDFNEYRTNWISPEEISLRERVAIQLVVDDVGIY